MNFCGLYRNNFAYLNDFLIPTITKLDQFENCNFYFYTNDSSDGTEELLIDFGKRYKNVSILSNKVGNKHFKQGFELERIQGLANARNQLLSLRPFAHHEWSVFVDSNIYFDPNIFKQFLESQKPKGGVAFSCRGLDYRRKCKIHDKCFAYYDMLAVIDSKSRQGFSIAKDPNFKWSCSFPFLDGAEQVQYNLGLPVQIECAFGGMCFYKTETINKSDVFYSGQIEKWHAIRDIPIYSEHWDFHARISKYGKTYAIPLKVYRDELHQFCKPV